MNLEAITDIFMDRMAELIDRLEDLPKECPEVLDSPTFKEMMEERDRLTKDMNDMADKINTMEPENKTLN